METLEQDRMINFIRGIAIFLMLWGHVLQFGNGNQIDYFENVVYKIIYSFHMPLFMLISGYLFYYSEKKRKMDELIEYKAKSLLYPILTWYHCQNTYVVFHIYHYLYLPTISLNYYLFSTDDIQSLRVRFTTQATSIDGVPNIMLCFLYAVIL